MDEMAMVNGFDTGLQRQRDKEADRDHQQLKKEVSPRSRRVMSRINIHLQSPR
jgi:hypothetical protein